MEKAEKLLKKHKIWVGVVIFLMTLFIVFGIYQIIYLRKVHSSFESYYAFRGCTQLLQRTDTFGICKTSNGLVLKIVKYQGRWYLDGDLPRGLLSW